MLTDESTFDSRVMYEHDTVSVCHFLRSHRRSFCESIMALPDKDYKMAKTTNVSLKITITIKFVVELYSIHNTIEIGDGI